MLEREGIIDFNSFTTLYRIRSMMKSSNKSACFHSTPSRTTPISMCIGEGGGKGAVPPSKECPFSFNETEEYHIKALL